MMKERPILFSGPMVRAILDGHKTQTRRVVIPQPWINDVGQWQWEHKKGQHVAFHPDLDEQHYPGTKLQHVCPYGVPSTRLWVRETFVLESNLGLAGLAEYPPPFGDTRPVQWVDMPDEGLVWSQPHYRATDPVPDLAYDDRDDPHCRWRPSIHMPRWASRITLEVEAVRVERLQEIDAYDAKAEGCDMHPGSRDKQQSWEQEVLEEYEALWDILNAKRGYGWDTNPWVWVIGFKRVSPATQWEESEVGR